MGPHLPGFSKGRGDHRRELIGGIRAIVDRELGRVEGARNLLNGGLHREEPVLDPEVRERDLDVVRAQDPELGNRPLWDLKVLPHDREHRRADSKGVAVSRDREPREDAEIGLDVLRHEARNADTDGHAVGTSRYHSCFTLCVRLCGAEVDPSRLGRRSERREDEQRTE